APCLITNGMNLEVAAVLKADGAECLQHLRYSLLVSVNPTILKRSNIEVDVFWRARIEGPRLAGVQRLVRLPHLIRSILDRGDIALRRRLLACPRRGSGCKTQSNQRYDGERPKRGFYGHEFSSPAN